MPVGFYRVVPMGEAVRVCVGGLIACTRSGRVGWPVAGNESEGEGFRRGDFLDEGVG